MTVAHPPTTAGTPRDRYELSCFVPFVPWYFRYRDATPVFEDGVTANSTWIDFAELPLSAGKTLGAW